MKKINIRLTDVKLENHKNEELSVCKMCKGRGYYFYNEALDEVTVCEKTKKKGFAKCKCEICNGAGMQKVGGGLL